MQLRVNFWSGPLHGSTALTSKLQDPKVFFNDSERLVYIYRRNERDYTFDAAQSLHATAVFDDVKRQFRPPSPESIKFDELPVREEDVADNNA